MGKDSQDFLSVSFLKLQGQLTFVTKCRSENLEVPLCFNDLPNQEVSLRV